MAESKKRGVLFDVDGTLIDSSYFHAFAWWQAFRREGLDVQISDIHRCVGMGGDKLVRHLVPDCTDELKRSRSRRTVPCSRRSGRPFALSRQPVTSWRRVPTPVWP